MGEWEEIRRKDWLLKHGGLNPKTPDWGKATLKCCFQKMLGAHRQWVRDGRG